MKYALPQIIFLFIALISTAPCHAIENVRIAYPFMSSSVFYLAIAEKEHYYEEEGLRTELISMRGDVAVKAVLAGDVDAFTSPGAALAGAVRGAPLKVLLLTQDRLALDFIAPREIRSIAQLRGATIGVTAPDSAITVATGEILFRNGVDPAKDVSQIILGGDNVRLMALRQKRIQATLLDAATSMKAVDDGFAKLASARDYLRFIQGGIVTSAEHLNQSSQRLGQFVRASLKGLVFFLTRRDAAITYIMNLMNYQNRQLAAAIYDSDTQVMLRSGRTDEKLLRQLIDDTIKRTKINRAIQVSDIFDFGLVERADQTLRVNGWKP
jgi:ABC-type nitrate/sulfonate/bicarbonate transport system substrate-binding protein